MSAYDQQDALASARRAVRRRSIDTGSVEEYLPVSERIELRRYREGERSSFAQTAERESIEYNHSNSADVTGGSDDEEEDGEGSVYDANEHSESEEEEVANSPEAAKEQDSSQEIATNTEGSQTSVTERYIETAEVADRNGATNVAETSTGGEQEGVASVGGGYVLCQDGTWKIPPGPPPRPSAMPDSHIKSRDGRLRIPPSPPPRPPRDSNDPGTEDCTITAGENTCHSRSSPMRASDDGDTQNTNAIPAHPDVDGARRRGRRRSISQIIASSASEQGTTETRSRRNSSVSTGSRGRRQSLSLEMMNVGWLRSEEGHGQDGDVSSLPGKNVGPTATETGNVHASHATTVEETLSSAYVARSLQFMKDQMTTHANVGVRVSTSYMQVVEGGAVDLYTLVLESEPRAPVRVIARCGEGKDLLITPSEIVFSPGDWFIPRSVRVTALDDLSSTGECRGIILHHCSSTDERYGPSLPVPPIKVTMIDADSGFLHSFGDRTFGKLGLGGSGIKHGTASLAEEALDSMMSFCNTPELTHSENKVMHKAVHEAIQHVGNPFAASTGQSRSVAGALKSTSIFTPQIVTLLPFPRLLHRVLRTIKNKLGKGKYIDGTSEELSRWKPIEDPVGRENVARRLICHPRFIWHMNPWVRLAVSSGNLDLASAVAQDQERARFELQERLSCQYVSSLSERPKEPRFVTTSSNQIDQSVDGLDRGLLEFQRQMLETNSAKKNKSITDGNHLASWEFVDTRLWQDQWDSSFSTEDYSEENTDNCSKAQEPSKTDLKPVDELPEESFQHLFFVRTDGKTSRDQDRPGGSQSREELDEPVLEVTPSDQENVKGSDTKSGTTRADIIEYFGLSRMKYRRPPLYAAPVYERSISRRHRGPSKDAAIPRLVIPLDSPHSPSGSVGDIKTSDNDEEESPSTQEYPFSFWGPASPTSPRSFGSFGSPRKTTEGSDRDVISPQSSSQSFETSECESSGEKEERKASTGVGNSSATAQTVSRGETIRSVIGQFINRKLTDQSAARDFSKSQLLPNLNTGNVAELRRRLSHMSTSRIRRILSEAEQELEGGGVEHLIFKEIQRYERTMPNPKHTSHELKGNGSERNAFPDKDLYNPNPVLQDWDLWNLSRVDEREKQLHILRHSHDHNLLYTFDPILQSLEKALGQTGEDIDETAISIVIQISLRKQQLKAVAEHRRVLHSSDDSDTRQDTNTPTSDSAKRPGDKKTDCNAPFDRALRRNRVAGALLFGTMNRENVNSSGDAKVSSIDRYAALGLNPKEMLAQSWKERQASKRGQNERLLRLTRVVDEVYTDNRILESKRRTPLEKTPYDADYDPLADGSHRVHHGSDIVEAVEESVSSQSIENGSTAPFLRADQPLKNKTEQLGPQGIRPSNRAYGADQVGGDFGSVAAAALFININIARRFRRSKIEQRSEQQELGVLKSHTTPRTASTGDVQYNFRNAADSEKTHRVFRKGKTVREQKAEQKKLRQKLTDIVEKQREVERVKQEEVDKFHSEVANDAKAKDENELSATEGDSHSESNEPNDGEETQNFHRISQAAAMAETVTRIAHIAVGQNHTLAIVSGGTLLAWGKGLHGQLGRGDNADARVPSLVRSVVHAPLVKVAGGANHSAAVSVEGDCFTWGRSKEGQTGHGTSAYGDDDEYDEDTEIPDDVNRFGGLVKLYEKNTWKGEEQPLDFKKNRRHAQFYDKEDVPVPRVVSYLGNCGRVVDVACGADHTLFLLVSGAVYSCGSNVAGQLGLGDKAPKYVYHPMRVSLPESAYHIGAGTFHSTCVVGSGDLYTFGLNSRGQLGLGNTVNRASPALVESISISRFLAETMRGTRTLDQLSQSRCCRIRKASCGGSHTAALTEDKKVLIWGSNEHGQLGLGNTKDVHLPEVVWPLENSQAIADVELGTNHSVFISELGALYVCGNGEFGSLGFPVHRIAKTNKKLCRIFRKQERSQFEERPTTASSSARRAMPLARGVREEKEMQKYSIFTVPVLLDSFVGMHVLSVACGSSHTVVLTDSVRSPTGKPWKIEKSKHLLDYTPPAKYRQKIIDHFLYDDIENGMFGQEMRSRSSRPASSRSEVVPTFGDERRSEDGKPKKKRRKKKLKRMKKRKRQVGGDVRDGEGRGQQPRVCHSNEAGILPSFGFVREGEEINETNTAPAYSGIGSPHQGQYRSEYSIATTTDDTDPRSTSAVRVFRSNGDFTAEKNRNEESTRPATASRVARNKPVRPPRRPKTAGYNRRQRHLQAVRQAYQNAM
eukprot:gb/GECG01000279.1/.p1 GENE.gb/GECG01000279.1/~~gb/GECG01000279.1/.p1  ORF type:complete len:2256 (+),score=290.68 gb/GECG01000279.1/:1-6768(+)